MPTELEKYLSEIGVTLKAKHSRLVTRESDGSAVKWPHDEWDVTVLYQGRKHSDTFKQGIGHRKPVHWVKVTGIGRNNRYDERRHCYYRDDVDMAESGASIPKPPTAGDVVACLVSDAQSAESTFEEWCSDLGYDSDSRKAFDTYQACLKIRSDMVRMFGVSTLNVIASKEH